MALVPLRVPVSQLPYPGDDFDECFSHGSRKSIDVTGREKTPEFYIYTADGEVLVPERPALGFHPTRERK